MARRIDDPQRFRFEVPKSAEDWSPDWELEGRAVDLGPAGVLQIVSPVERSETPEYWVYECDGILTK